MNFQQEEYMIIELRKKSPLTLPKEIVKKLNLIDGDKLDVTVVDGKICLEPIVVYLQKYYLTNTHIY